MFPSGGPIGRWTLPHPPTYLQIFIMCTRTPAYLYCTLTHMHLHTHPAVHTHPCPLAHLLVYAFACLVPARTPTHLDTHVLAQLYSHPPIYTHTPTYLPYICSLSTSVSTSMCSWLSTKFLMNLFLRAS